MRKCFDRFKFGYFFLEDQKRSTKRQLTETGTKSKSTIHDHIVKLGYINRLDVWISQRFNREASAVLHSFYDQKEETPCFKQLLTGDEK